MRLVAFLFVVVVVVVIVPLGFW